MSSRDEQAGVASIEGSQDERDDSASSRQPSRPGYLAFVAHEMRNPLSTALWSAELLTRLSPEDRAGPRGEKLAGMCLRTLSRLRHLVEDHFLAERLATRGIPIRLEGIDLREALAAATGRIPGVRCESKVDGVSVSADRAMLERTLEALVAAAARDGADVTVSAEVGAGTTEIWIRGAEPLDEAGRIPDRSTPSDPTGRALGLLMARSVAEAHGGGLRLSKDGYVLMLPSGLAREER